MKRVLIFVFFCINMCLTAATIEVDPFRETANKTLPLRDTFYEYSEVWGALFPHLLKSEDFEYPLQMMFNQLPAQLADKDLCFPSPPHMPAIVTGGWQCLLGKVLRAKSERDVAGQQIALLTLLGLHKSVLEMLAPALGETAKILLVEVQKAVPCERCLEGVRGAYITSK